MGNKFEVWSWEKMSEEDGYEYIQKYAGEDLDEAMTIMCALKSGGIGCVKLEWSWRG